MRALSVTVLGQERLSEQEAASVPSCPLLPEQISTGVPPRRHLKQGVYSQKKQGPLPELEPRPVEGGSAPRKPNRTFPNQTPYKESGFWPPVMGARETAQESHSKSNVKAICPHLPAGYV